MFFFIIPSLKYFSCVDVTLFFFFILCCQFLIFQELARRNQIEYVETSAKSGEGVMEAFELLSKLILMASDDYNRLGEDTSEGDDDDDDDDDVEEDDYASDVDGSQFDS